MKQKVSLGEMQFSSAGVGSLHCPWHPGLLKGGFSCVPCDRLPGTLSLLWLGVSAHTCSLLPCRLALCSCYSLPVGATLGRLELLGDGREFKQLKMWFFSILYKSSALITSPSKKKIQIIAFDIVGEKNETEPTLGNRCEQLQLLTLTGGHFAQ